MLDVHDALTALARLAPAPARHDPSPLHDELLFEVRTEAVEEVAALVREERMAGAVSLAVPLDVDVGRRRQLEGREGLATAQRSLNVAQSARSAVAAASASGVGAPDLARALGHDGLLHQDVDVGARLGRAPPPPSGHAASRPWPRPTRRRRHPWRAAPRESSSSARRA